MHIRSQEERGQIVGHKEKDDEDNAAIRADEVDAGRWKKRHRTTRHVASYAVNHTGIISRKPITQQR